MLALFHLYKRILLCMTGQNDQDNIAVPMIR